MARLRIAAAQLNLVVGDLDGNATRILTAYEQAEAAGCDLVAFPELAVCGYPPEDLLFRSAFVAQAGETLAKIAARTGHAAAVIGFPEARGDLYNAAAVCSHGEVVGTYRKHLLPNYSVFDEERYFEASDVDGPLFVIGGCRVGVSICEDIWGPKSPVLEQVAGGAELLVNINASPYYAGRLRERETILSTRANEVGVPILYVNLVGGQDELVFDGASMVVSETGAVAARGRQFTEDLLVVDVDVPSSFRRRAFTRSRVHVAPLPEISISIASLVSTGLLSADRDTRSAAVRSRADGDVSLPARIDPPLDPVREVYEALVLGTRDYVRKNGFAAVLIGLSGGIDSSLVAAIAVDALGPEHVTGVLMPSRYSSAGSVTDADALVTNLAIDKLTVPIEEAHAAFLHMLETPLQEGPPGLAEENLQARVRGTVLMTLSNKLDRLVLTTGNKSEMATGFSTLYGDMAGGFAVIKDVPKMLVYALARDRNDREPGRAVIPETVLDKPPSAELRPDQRDTDSLPPYEVLDAILESYVEGDKSADELAGEGHEPALVRRVASLVDRNEYKRRQAPPGVRVSPKAFGKDRRLPITNRWRG